MKSRKERWEDINIRNNPQDPHLFFHEKRAKTCQIMYTHLVWNIIT